MFGIVRRFQPHLSHRLFSMAAKEISRVLVTVVLLSGDGIKEGSNDQKAKKLQLIVPPSFYEGLIKSMGSSADL